MSQPTDPPSQGSWTLVQTLSVKPPQIPTQLSYREFSSARDITQCYRMGDALYIEVWISSVICWNIL